MKERVWFKYFFRALIYLLIGLFILLASLHKSALLTGIGMIVFVGGAVLMAMSLISFIRWLVK